MPRFDPDVWDQKIKNPDWYLDYVQLATQVKEEFGDVSTGQKEFNKQARGFFEQALADGKVNLAKTGPNLDEVRLPIDRIVIHHTSAAPGYKLSYMEATQLLNIYAPTYANAAATERGIKGKAIWSGHFKDGRISFLAYHWLMRMDGSFERLLDDNQIGRHAGNWQTNRRSIAICLDNDYEHKDPDSDLLKRVAEHIKKHYPYISKDQIIGHCEANKKTSCPGLNFLDGWKRELAKYF